jgi:hypothetical protein
MCNLKTDMKIIGRLKGRNNTQKSFGFFITAKDKKFAFSNNLVWLVHIFW